MVSKPINPFCWSFSQVQRLVTLVSFDLIEWKLCFVGMNVVLGRKTSMKTQTHEVNQAWLIGPLFHQEALYMARCGGNHFLPSDSHSSQWRSCSWCMWPKVHIIDVDICLTNVSQVEGICMDPIKVRVHCEASLWQTQRSLVSMGKCGWVNYPRWFPTTLRSLIWTINTKGALGICTKT
jgi:hypothetical protein